MVKNIELMVRAGGLSREAFLEALTGAHAEKAREIPAIRGYIVNEVIPTPPRKDIAALKLPALDAVTEIWYDDLEAARAAQESPEMKAWLEARRALLGGIKRLVTVEHPEIPLGSPRPALKNFAFVNRHMGMTLPEFLNEWLVEHGPMAHAVPHLRGFLPNEVIAEMPQEGVEPLDTGVIEGVALACFSDPEEEALMIASPEARLWFKHGGVNFGRVKGMDAWERVIIAPGEADGHV